MTTHTRGFHRALVAGAIFGVVAPTTAFADPSACVHLYLNVNGTTQAVDQCAP